MPQRQLRYLGYVLWGSNLEKDCLLGTFEDTITRGKQIIKLIDGIKRQLRSSGLGDVIRLEQNTQEWRNNVAIVNIVMTRW